MLDSRESTVSGSLQNVLHFDALEAVGPRRMFATLAPERLAHGYLFVGNEGIGKKHFARLLARSLLCITPNSSLLGYCDVCDSCRLIDAKTNPDFFYHEGEIRIGDRDGDDELTARELVRILSLHSYGAGRRVLILADVAFATHHAANALLKFFEEPPSGVVLILTTSTPGRVLETIRSRLVEVPFSPLSTNGVATLLEREGIEPAIALQAAQVSQGSVTRGRGALDAVQKSDVVRDWFFDAVAGRPADGSWAARQTLEANLDTIALLVRDWAIATSGAQHIGGLSGESKRIGLLPKDQKRALGALETLAERRRTAKTNVSPGLIVDGLRLAFGPSTTAERG